jgi:L-fuculose-phosphate aldolase
MLESKGKAMLFAEGRAEIADLGRRLEHEGLLNHTAGNLSARVAPDRVLISPTSIPYPRITAADVVVVDLDGHVVEGDRRPSSELAMHLMLYRIRPDAGGVVHTHAPFATTFAVLNMPIPAVHYEIAALAIDQVPVVPYATYGTVDLAEHVREAMGDANAALLANHGTIAVGPTLGAAATFTQILESLATLYYRARLFGQPVILPRDEIMRVRQKFAQSARQLAPTQATDS